MSHPSPKRNLIPPFERTEYFPPLQETHPETYELIEALRRKTHVLEQNSQWYEERYKVILCQFMHLNGNVLEKASHAEGMAFRMTQQANEQRQLQEKHQHAIYALTAQLQALQELVIKQGIRLDELERARITQSKAKPQPLALLDSQ